MLSSAAPFEAVIDADLIALKLMENPVFQAQMAKARTELAART